MAEATLGPYLINHRIAGGGQGTVFRGFDTRLRREVAIKIYNLASRDQEQARVLEEARLVASIRHPRVIEVYDVVVAPHSLALVSPYVPGCDLEVVLQQIPLSLPTLLGVVVDVAGALAAVRREGLVHGDIKPSNLLVGRDGRVTLTDFGLSQRRATLSEGRGSLSCLAPEQLLRQPLTPATDLFALGTLLYRLLTGRAPYVVDGVLQQELLLQGQAPPLAPRARRFGGLPPSLVPLVNALLAADPQQRPRDIREVRQQLMQVWSELPVSSHATLARDAAPYFRERRSDYDHLELPPELLQQGRSSLRPPDWRQRAFWCQDAVRRRVRAIGLVTVLLGVTAWVGFDREPPALLFPQPGFSKDPDFPVDRRLSALWLEAEVLSVAQAMRTDRVLVSGAAGQTRLRLDRDGNIGNMARDIPEVLQLQVNCESAYCLVAANYRRGNRVQQGQSMLLASASLAQWRVAVRTAVAGALQE